MIVFLRVEIISREKESKITLVGFQEEVETVTKGWVSCQSKEDDKKGNKTLWKEKMPLKELNKDVG